MEQVSLLKDFATVLLVAGVAGWVFRKLGLSAVVGYLLAGIFVGPYTPPFSLVSDVARIQDLSELGLAFLMFFVGLGLSFQRIKRLGAGVVVTTVITATLVFVLAQAFAWGMGWNQIAGVIFAALFMTSSSAIIVKLLAERGLSHERFAQTAQGVTILEDIVAVVMLTLIGSRLNLSGEASQGVGQTLSLLLGFVALLVVLGLLFVPRILRRVGRASDADIKSLVVSGLVFGAGVVAVRAGFSVALGAFLLGVVVSETPFRAQIERRLAGAQDMFSAIFFVSIGMLIDVRAFWDHAGLIVLISIFAIGMRSLAAFAGILGSGGNLAHAASAAIILTPIGEFAYIIAQVGVGAGAVPGSFYAVAVGVSLITAMMVPLFASRAERFGQAVERRFPNRIKKLLEAYQDWLAGVGQRAARNQAWQFSRRGVLSSLVEVIMLAGLFGFSRPVQAGIAEFFQRMGFALPGWNVVYWALVLIAGVFLVVAILRNIEATSMIYAEVLTMHADRLPHLRPIVRLGMQTLGAVGLAVVIYFTFPLQTEVPWLMLVMIGAPVIFGVVLWRQIIRLQSGLERRIAETMQPEQGPQSKMARAVSEDQGNWNMDVAEAMLPDRPACAGQTIRDLALRARFGCSILEIDRQGFVIKHPRPSTALYPGDRVLLFGTEEQIAAGRRFLQTERDALPDESAFDDAVLETVLIPEASPAAGHTLNDLQVFQKTGVQIIGIEKDGRRILNPSGTEELAIGARLLVIGTETELRGFREWLSTV